MAERCYFCKVSDFWDFADLCSGQMWAGLAFEVNFLIWCAPAVTFNKKIRRRVVD